MRMQTGRCSVLRMVLNTWEGQSVSTSTGCIMPRTLGVVERPFPGLLVKHTQQL
jgi:hypothetical protein